MSGDRGDDDMYMDATLSSRPVRMVMRSPCAGDALDPPLWKIRIKALSLPPPRQGGPHGQTESWSPCAQGRCHPTGRCTYRPSVTL